MSATRQHDDRPRPRAWTMNDWYVQNSLWRTSQPADGVASIEPSEAEAYSGQYWTVTYTVGRRPLKTGSHVAIEVPSGWGPHLGRPMRDGRGVLAMAGDINPGFASWTRVEAEGAAKVKGAVSWCNRFTILDVVVTEGTLQPGQKLWLHLGTEDASKLRCQPFAQQTPLAMGVDYEGDGTYLPLEPPIVQVTGARAAALRLITPATVQPNEEFEAFVQAVDIYGANPAAGYEGTIDLKATGPVVDVPPAIGIAPRGSWEGKITCRAGNASGVAHIRALDADRWLAGRSNPVGVGFCEKGERIAFGDLHGQVYVSIGTGTLDDYYTWAREVEHLDFCAPANHYGGRMDFDNLPQWAQEREEALKVLWAEDVAKCNQHYSPGEFVTLVGFEWGCGRYGHRNVYFRGDNGVYIRGQDGMTLEELWQRLEDEGYAALTVPHHLKFCSPVDWSSRNDRFQRLAEICSAWGISEEGGSHSARSALAMGHRLGFVGGTDTHYGQPGRSPHFFGEGGGLTAVYVPELTREALWDALYNRRCYATTGARILLDCRINGHPMGSEIITESDIMLEARVVGTIQEYAVDVVRNGKVVHSIESEDFECSFTWADASARQPTRRDDYYYLRVRQADRHMAWSSPIWVNLT